MQGPWPPHQDPRPDPTEIESGPIAVPDPGPEGTAEPERSAHRSQHRSAPEPFSGTQKESAMYPPRFRYERPASLDEVIGLLSNGRRRGQGAGRRAEPGAADEAAVRGARAARRHQRPAGARPPPRGGRRHAPHRGAVPARHAGALHDPPRQPTHDGRRGAADRRPDRAQPRHAGRLVVPRRPAGRLGGGRDGARRQRRRAGSGRAPDDRRSPTSSPDRSRTPSPTTRSRSRPSSPRPRAPGPAATSSSSGGSATSPPPAWRSPSSHRGPVGRAGIALTGVGGATIDARDAADSLVGQRARAATSPEPPTSRPRPRGRGPTTAAAPRTSGTSCTPSSRGS